MPNVNHTILLASFLLTWFRNSTAAHPQRAILKGDLVTTEDHFPLLTTRKGARNRGKLWWINGDLMGIEYFLNND